MGGFSCFLYGDRRRVRSSAFSWMARALRWPAGLGVPANTLARCSGPSVFSTGWRRGRIPWSPSLLTRCGEGAAVAVEYVPEAGPLAYHTREGQSAREVVKLSRSFHTVAETSLYCSASVTSTCAKPPSTQHVHIAAPSGSAPSAVTQLFGPTLSARSNLVCKHHLPDATMR